MKFDPDVYPILEFINKNPNAEETREYAFKYAINFYNEKKYFEAHEVWEFQWRKEEGDFKLFIQALIQIAVAMNKLYVNVNLAGALSQTKLALEKMKLLEQRNNIDDRENKFLANLIVNLNLLIYLLSNELEYITYLPPEIPVESYLFFIG